MVLFIDKLAIFYNIFVFVVDSKAVIEVTKLTVKLES